MTTSEEIAAMVVFLISAEIQPHHRPASFRRRRLRSSGSRADMRMRISE